MSASCLPRKQPFLATSSTPGSKNSSWFEAPRNGNDIHGKGILSNIAFFAPESIAAWMKRVESSGSNPNDETLTSFAAANRLFYRTRSHPSDVFTASFSSFGMAVATSKPSNTIPLAELTTMASGHRRQPFTFSNRMFSACVKPLP